VGASLALKLGGVGPKLGFGPAFNYAHHLENVSIGDYRSTVGAYFWSYYYPWEQGDLVRLGIGGQASYSLVGIEIGPSILFGRDVLQGAASWTPFASIGFVWVGLRFNIGNIHSDYSIFEFIAGAGYPFGFQTRMLDQVGK
jgi:hypothetical protein